MRSLVTQLYHDRFLKEVKKMDSNNQYDPSLTTSVQSETTNAQSDGSNTNPETRTTRTYETNASPAVENIQTETHSSRAEGHPAKRIVGVVFAAVEVVLGLRLVLMLFGANAENAFVTFLYGFTGYLVKLFEGIFAQVTINEASGAVFEPATLIAMVLIALIAWGVLKLMASRAGTRTVKTDYSGPSIQRR